MNIGLFSETYYPEINGVAASVLILKEQLEKQGHNVYVFTTTNPAVKKREKHVYRMPSMRFRLRRLGMFVNPRLKYLVKRLDLDVVHTHTEFSLGIFGRSVARSMDLPLVHTMHTIYEEYTDYLLKLGLLEPAIKAAARKFTAAFCNTASFVVAPTQKTKDLLREYGVSRNMYVIPTGVKLDKFSAENAKDEILDKLRAELGLVNNGKTLVYVGRVSKEKNIEEVLQYLGSYLPKHPEVTFLVVGGGPALPGLVQQAEDLGVSKQVVFAGEKPWDDIGWYYRLGDVFVSASQSETQGLTYIEALASGLPLVVKTDPCLDGVLFEGENGCAFTDEATFTSALDKILMTDGERERMSQNALTVAHTFSAEHYGATLESIYIAAIAGNKKFVKAS